MSESPSQEADVSTSNENKEIPPCPTCGKDDFASAGGMKIHHAKVHGESLAGSTLECERCGSTFTVEDSWKAEHQDYCSPDCAMDAREGDGPEMASGECIQCGEEFTRKASIMRASRGDFCGRDCFYEWQQGENHPNWKGGPDTVECAICGDEVERYVGTKQVGDTPVCSVECNGKLTSKRQRGEDHPMWNGGGAVGRAYQSPWPKNREKALERDGYECRACGMSQEEHKEEYDRELDVHHVVPVREFDSPEEAHKLENLVTACRSCHGKYEGVPVFPHRNK